MRAQFAKIGVEAGKPFPAGKLTPAQKAMLETAMKRGLEKIKQTVATLGKDENAWRVMTNGFGNRQDYAGDWTLRAATAVAGIYGNSPAEAVIRYSRPTAMGTNPIAP